MGYGDELLGSGIAKGAAARGERIAFGNGRTVIWHRNAYEVFLGNPNVLAPGQHHRGPVKWVRHFPSERLYCRINEGNRKWTFNPDFRATPGEFFLMENERKQLAHLDRFDVLIEPNTKNQAPNKQWPLGFYQVVADRLQHDGLSVAQLRTGRNELEGVRVLSMPSFRQAAALLERSTLYIGPEGGLHHAAAALGVKAVVIFGGFIHPDTTGYVSHINLFHGDKACGNIDACEHCRKAMNAIEPEQVIEAAARSLETDRRVLAAGR